VIGDRLRLRTVSRKESGATATLLSPRQGPRTVRRARCARPRGWSAMT